MMLRGYGPFFLLLMTLFRTRDGLVTINMDRIDYAVFDPEQDWVEVFLFGNSITLGGEDAAEFQTAWRATAKRLIQASYLGGVA